jgi:hypothetical protein
MRIRRRSAIVLAMTMAFGVGLIAFPGSAAALATCTPKASGGNDSCVRLAITALAPPLGPAYENVRLGVRMRTVFQAPATPGNCASGGCWEANVLRFDDDIGIDLAAIPVCPMTSLSGKDIATAWANCGPPAGAGNAYLSTGLGSSVSGRASTIPPGNFEGCTMVFKGPYQSPLNPNPAVWLYMRFNTSGHMSCAAPATNTGGNVTILRRGFFLTVSGPYTWRLRFPDLNTTGLILDDFNATLQRGASFQARCPAGTSPHILQGFFDYTEPQPTDTISPPYPGTTDPCP